MIAWEKTREAKLKHLDVALTYVRQFRLAIDVGAHQGLWTEVMANRFQRVIAIEPFEGNHEFWRKRLAGSPNAELWPIALGDENTKVRLVGKKHSLHYCVADSQGSVNMRRLDDQPIADLDLLKIDAEGADPFVVKGAEHTIRTWRPVVVVEWHPRFDKRYGLKPQLALEFLESWGAKQVAVLRHDYIYRFDG